MDSFQYFDKVHSFYSDSFNQLLTLTIAVLTISGVILPFVLQFIQNKLMKADQKALQNQISVEIAEALNKMKNDSEESINAQIASIKTQLENDKNEMESGFEIKYLKASAGVYFLQGRVLLDNKDYVGAIQSFCTATIYALGGNDEMNALRAVDTIKRNIENLNNKDFSDELELNNRLDELISCLDSKNINGRYSDLISEIKRKRENAKRKAPSVI